MKRISAIVPVYNRRTMAEEALRSIAEQTRPPDEIILVDDGSEDASHEAAGVVEGVRLVRQPNLGVSAARNAGIRIAKGDYIAFLDSDDLWARDKLQEQELFMTAHPELPLCHTDETWFRDGRRVNPKHYHRKEGGFLFRRSLERCLISPSAVMLRREIFDIVGLFDERLIVCEDYDLWLRITARYPVGFVPSSLTIKRGGHPDQLSRKLDVMDIYRVQALAKVLRERVLAREDREAALAMVDKKTAIICAGLKKRNKKDAAASLEQLAAQLKGEEERGMFTQRGAKPNSISKKG